MTGNKTYHPIPPSRITTFDVFAIGLTKHHVVSLLEVDVTLGRQKIRELRRSGARVSFNGWLVKAISKTIFFDHDAIDGAPMARFVKDLVRNMEAGVGL